MATSVHDLDLPELDMFGLSREEGLAAFDAVRDQHWLARGELGYVVMRYDDVVAILRDRRFHSAFSMITAMSGLEPEDDPMLRRQQQSILAMEGPEHARLRRLVASAFTPKSAD